MDAPSRPVGSTPIPDTAQPARRQVRPGLDSLVEHHLNGQALPIGSIRDPFGRAISQGGFDALRDKTQAHRDAIAATGVGTHYGDHSSFHNLSPEEKRNWIERNKTPGTTPPMPRRSSCIGWALENVGAAYAAAGRSDRWREIYKRVTANGAKGTDLAKELEKDGWQAVYFNPDSHKTNDGRDEHGYTAARTRKGKPYYGISVSPDRMVVDYNPVAGGGTRERTDGLDRLANVPFWFGVASGGSHTFVGSGTTVNEFHWANNPDSTNAIDETPLKDFAWRSGVIMVPPGTWR